MAENKGVEVVDGIRFFLLFYVLFSAVFSALFGRAPKGSGYPLQVLAPPIKIGSLWAFHFYPSRKKPRNFNQISLKTLVLSILSSVSTSISISTSLTTIL